MNGIASLDRHAVRLHRLAHSLHARGYFRLAAGVAAVNKILTGVEIAPQARIGPNFTIVHGVGVVIGRSSVIGPDCVVYQGVTLGTRVEVGDVFDRDAVEPRLGVGVTVYAGAKLLGPVAIGDGAVVGANAVVLKDVPAGMIAVGVPAVVRAPRATAE